MYIPQVSLSLGFSPFLSFPMHPLVVELFFILAWMTGASIAQQSCSLQNPCPAPTPCCSEYGFCGTGPYCGLGCNPMGSASLSSCAPKPSCRNQFYNFSDPAVFNRIANVTSYDGNATAFDWVLKQGNVSHSIQNGLRLWLTEENGGTLLSSTRYMQYGNISYTYKAPGANGTVLANILMGDLRENMTENRSEIDWEQPGIGKNNTQFNYFASGPSTFNNGVTLVGFSDEQISTTYTFAWTNETIRIFINDKGPIMTFNHTDHLVNGVATFPNDTAAAQISLWPAGIPGVSNGTVQWAGGMINWSDLSYVTNKGYYADIESVNISCYNETETTSQSWVYNKGLTPSTPELTLSNQSTIFSVASSTLVNAGRQLRRALVVVSPTPDVPILSLSNQSTEFNGARATLGSTGQLRRALVVVVGLILISCVL